MVAPKHIIIAYSSTRSIGYDHIDLTSTGRIGKRVIENLSGFGCRILAYNKYESDAVRKYARYVTWEEFLAENDLIPFHIAFYTDQAVSDMVGIPSGAVSPFRMGRRIPGR
ncbi:hypothetical protein FACS189483_05510 [Spirochaetia bacterium]|nr:hypothetical protein FACS189483_05510 [Spirochaetia bacterium]